MKKLLVSLLLAFATSLSSAQTTATISSVAVALGTSGSYRIYQTGIAPMCPGGTNWAYITNDDPYYSATVATLELAYSKGRSVTVNSTLNSGACQITYIVMN